MIQNTGPTKLPVIILPILVAGIMAISGYVLFSIRYGGPIREANLATKRVQELEKAIPEMIQTALVNRPTDHQPISQNDIENSNSENKRSLLNSFDPNPLTQRQDQLDTTINEAESRIVQLENAVKALQLELTYYRKSSPEIKHQPTIHDPARTPTPSLKTPPPEVVILASDTKNNVQVALHRAWTTSGRVILEATITKLSSEDGYFAIENYSRDSVKKRITTADGINISGLRIQQQGKSEQSSASCDLIPGIPMKFTFYFSKGDIPTAPFMARRIEFIAYTDRAGKIPLLYQFDNVVISE